MKTRGTTQGSPVDALMLWMAVGSFAVGIVVRVFAAQNDLWFDELWSHSNYFANVSTPSLMCLLM